MLDWLKIYSIYLLRPTYLVYIIFQGRNLSKILFVFWAMRQLHIFILRFHDLYIKTLNTILGDFFFSIWTFLLFSKWISIIQDHFQNQDGKFCFLYCALYSTVITVRSTNKKLIALYYYYGQTVGAKICLFVCFSGRLLLASS